MSLKVLVVGQGSIGRRHGRLAKELGAAVASVSAYGQPGETCFADLKTGLREFAPTHLLIANPTGSHKESLQAALELGFTGPILVEKPIFDSPLALPYVNPDQIQVAYNLRFHPLLGALKAQLEGQRPLTAQLYVGQYLPTWRPERPYQESYSAKKAEGGGALRDLSHELDSLMWLLGPWKAVSALGGKSGSLEIDSDDHFCLLLELEGGVHVTLEVNYLDRNPARRINVNCDQTSFYADLGQGLLKRNGEETRFQVERDHTYTYQLKAFLGLTPGPLCPYPDALAVLHLIAGAEQAVQQPYSWVLNPKGA